MNRRRFLGQSAAGANTTAPTGNNSSRRSVVVTEPVSSGTSFLKHRKPPSSNRSPFRGGGRQQQRKSQGLAASDALQKDGNVASLYPAGRSRPSSADSSRPSSSGPARIRPSGPEQQELSPKEMDPSKEGAMQFLPAFASAEQPPASWDALLQTEEQKQDGHSTHSATTSNLAARARELKLRRRKQQQLVSPVDQASSVVSNTLQPGTTQRPTAPSPQDNLNPALSSAHSNAERRVTRLAAIFHQNKQKRNLQEQRRADASPLRQATTQEPTSTAIPPGSPTDSGSSGYVGWPGTQDRGGGTVTIQSSYDDSSAGAGTAVSAPMDPAMRRHFGNNANNPEHAPSSVASSVLRNLSDLSAIRYAQSDVAGQQSMSSRAKHKFHSRAAQHRRFFPKQNGNRYPNQNTNHSNHSVGSKVDSLSSPGSGSLTSSAYLNVQDMGQLAYPNLDTNDQTNGTGNDTPEYPAFRPSQSIIQPRIPCDSPVTAAAPPTEALLAENDRLAPPHRTFQAAKGFRGLLNKTEEVPCLMDAHGDSDSMTSSKAASVTRDNYRGVTAGDEGTVSDVFDNLPPSPKSASILRSKYPSSIAEEPHDTEDVNNVSAEPQEDDYKLVLLGGGLTAIQSTSTGFGNRNTASDFDDNLTNSTVDQNGFAALPGFHEMVNKGRSDKDSALSGIQGNFNNAPKQATSEQPNISMVSSEDDSSLFPDPYAIEGNDSTLSSGRWDGGRLSQYCVDPRQMKRLIRRYRQLSEHVDFNSMSLEDFEREDDEHKAFALVEMRSRVMEKDIERGLERRGGTVVCDDLALTPYFKVGQRIRDACIVSKAWRDGASPEDVINAAILTRRSERTYYIRRRVDDNVSNDSMSAISGFAPFAQCPRRYTWEAVQWVDDMDFSLYRCPSLGPRSMCGFEMFTVGDCQSILLKLTNEHCLVCSAFRPERSFLGVLAAHSLLFLITLCRFFAMS